jgi:hypothetical protein
MKASFILVASVCSGLACSGFCQTNENLVEKIKNETFKNTAWGQASNNIQFGIELGAVGPKNADTLKVFTHLFNVGSTNIYGLWKLPAGYRLEMTLKTKAGEEINKTSTGNALCQTLTRDTPYDGKVVVLYSKSPEDYDELFDLRDSFQIKEPGTYILTIKARLYALNLLDELGAKVPLDVPPATIEFSLGGADLKP